MSQVLSEDRFSVRDEQSMQIALAMTRRRLHELEVPAMLVSKLMTISSELLVNVLKYATQGTLYLRQIRGGDGLALEVSVVDEGPGIPDVEKAMEDHYSTQGTLGLGLPAVKRMADEFRVESELGKGTRVDALVRL